MSVPVRLLYTDNMTKTETANKFGVKAGDIFYCSWGYDQTNVYFYEVARVTATKAEMRPIGGHRTDAGKVPNPDYTREYDVLIDVDRSDDVKSKLCTVKTGYSGRATVVLHSGRYFAYPYEGKAMYETEFGMGH